MIWFKVTSPQGDCLLNLEALADLSSTTNTEEQHRVFSGILEKVMKERDTYADNFMEMAQDVVGRCLLEIFAQENHITKFP